MNEALAELRAFSVQNIIVLVKKGYNKPNLKSLYYDAEVKKIPSLEWKNDCYHWHNDWNWIRSGKNGS